MAPANRQMAAVLATGMNLMVIASYLCDVLRTRTAKAPSPGNGSRLWFETNEFLNLFHGLRKAGNQTIGLRSLETAPGFIGIAAEPPDAHHHFELGEPFADLLAKGSRRGERIRR